jgi:hypothetical protein
MNERKVFGRTVVITLGLVCIILAAGMVAAIVVIVNTDNTVSSLNSQISSVNSQVGNLQSQITSLQNEIDTLLGANITFASADEITRNPSAYENRIVMVEGGLVSYPALNWSYPPWNYELRPSGPSNTSVIGVDWQDSNYNLDNVLVLGYVIAGKWTTLTENGTVHGPVVYFIEAQRIVVLYAFSDYYLALIGPTYSGITTSTTVPGSPCLFSCYWAHPNGLSTYVFSINQTGTWVNTTGTFTENPTLSWSNVTDTLPTTAGVTVGFEWYANSTYGFWTATGI